MYTSSSLQWGTTANAGGGFNPALLQDFIFNSCFRSSELTFSPSKNLRALRL